MSEMRDHREITVAGDARSARPIKTAAKMGAKMGANAGRRPATHQRTAEASEWRMMLGAVASGTFRICRANPGALLGSVVALGAVAVVSMNALGYQTGRHPAPILPKIAIRQDAVRKEPLPKTVPERTADSERPAEPARAPGRTVEAGKPAGRDAIADLIRSDETTASVTPKAGVSTPAAAVAPPKPRLTVMQAQKALSKLGYGPLKADGLMGATTRSAIEKFERDRKLPVKGEATGRTLRELAARAALPPA